MKSLSIFNNLVIGPWQLEDENLNMTPSLKRSCLTNVYTQQNSQQSFKFQNFSEVFLTDSYHSKVFIQNDVKNSRSINLKNQIILKNYKKQRIRKIPKATLHIQVMQIDKDYVNPTYNHIFKSNQSFLSKSNSGIIPTDKSHLISRPLNPRIQITPQITPRKTISQLAQRKLNVKKGSVETKNKRIINLQEAIKKSLLQSSKVKQIVVNPCSDGIFQKRSFKNRSYKIGCPSFS